MPAVGDPTHGVVRNAVAQDLVEAKVEDGGACELELVRPRGALDEFRVGQFVPVHSAVVEVVGLHVVVGEGSVVLWRGCALGSAIVPKWRELWLL